MSKHHGKKINQLTAEECIKIKAKLESSNQSGSHYYDDVCRQLNSLPPVPETNKKHYPKHAPVKVTEEPVLVDPTGA